MAKKITVRYLLPNLALVIWLISCSATPERQARGIQSGGYGDGFAQAGSSQNRKPVLGKEGDLLLGAATVLRNMARRSPKGIPRRLLRNAKAIVIVPNLLAQSAAPGGRRYARGVAVIRSAKTGKWERPVFIKTSPTGWGAQAGVRKVKLILLALTKKGVKQLLGTEFNQGTAPKVSFGPRTATGQLNMQQLMSKADIYAYAKVQGAFAGLAFKTPSIVSDKDSGRRFYGRPLIRETDATFAGESIPSAAGRFIAVLNKIAPPPKKVFRSVRASPSLDNS